MSVFDRDRLERLDGILRGHVDGGVTGAVWLVAGRDPTDVHVGWAGVRTRGATDPVDRTSVFRIASMTKPVAAVAALSLVEEGVLRFDDPVDALLPELAGRRVLVDPAGPVDGATVPAHRPITVEDVLTFRLGWGMDFEAPWPQPFLEGCAALGLGAGPPAPAVDPEPDEWIHRLATLPLVRQPGERWLYNTGSDVLGVLVARAAGRPFDVVLRERVFEPLGMHDTGFWTADADRLVSCYAGADVYDGPDGQWSSPPRFPSGAGGLVSTIDDLQAFARMLLAGGGPVLSRVAVDAMTTDHLLPGQGGPLPTSLGWGFGVGVQRRRTGVGRGPGSYGWDGGLGTSWANDPGEGLIGIILTNDMFTQAYPPPAIVQDFWTSAYAALA